jgi:hypothetical protein
LTIDNLMFSCRIPLNAIGSNCVISTGNHEASNL